MASFSDAHTKVAIIGAGLSGIAMGVQLKRKLGHVNFEIFESTSDVGGTWSQNTYPNLSCDVASQFYSFSFFPSPNWTETYATQPEILSYIHNCVDHFSLRPHIKLQQKCESARWSKEQQLWSVSILDVVTGKRYTVLAKILVTAVGVLNVPQEEPALQGFRGEVFHTSQWRDVDFKDKKVMVLGNGCSANQVIPWILNETGAKSLVHIFRSAQWVAPKGNVKNGEGFKWILRNIPFANTTYRLWTALQLDLGIFAFRTNALGNYLRSSIATAVKSYMESSASPRYHEMLTPHYNFGAKRPVMDHGYLESTKRENITLIKCDGVKGVINDGKTIVDADGGEHNGVDIVILANGFKTQELLTPMEIWGAGEGVELRRLWKEVGGARAYMGVCVSDFPNFFMLAGPNTLPTGNSTLHGIECSVVYILRLLRPLIKKPFGYIMPRREAEDQYNDWIQKHLRNMVYTKEVDTWYIDKQTGRNTLIWPGSQFSFWWSRCVAWVRMRDFVVVGKGKV